MRGLEFDQLRYLVRCSTAPSMWAKLNMHAEQSEQSSAVLLDKFINAKMEVEEKMADYII